MADVASLLIGLPPWQRRAAAAVLEGGVQYGGRCWGRASVSRILAEVHATAGEHTHVGGRDGGWCVTRQPAGYLWVRLSSS
jgi:hypothetical protein